MSAIRQRINVFLLAAGCWCGMSPSCGVAQSSYTGGSFSTLLPTSWKTLNAVEPVGNVIYVAGGGDGGGKLGVYDSTAGKFSDLSDVLPASWCQGIRTISYGDNVLLIGGQGPSRVGIYSLTSQSFQDLTSKLTDYHYGLNAAAFNGSQFLIGGAGFSTSMQLVSPAGQFTSLAPKIPFYFAVNTAVSVGGSIFIAGAGPGPGPGQPPALGSVAADGSFTDLTHSLPSGWGASWHSAYNGSVLLLQGFDSASGAHQLLALFNPTSKTITDATASFPASFQLHGSGGGNGNFLVGGQLNGSAYLALYSPRSAPTAFTTVLPAGAQDVTAIKIAGSVFVVGGINKGGQIFLVGGPITTITTSSTGLLAPASSETTTSTSSGSAGWQLVWSNEFNEATLDTSIWTCDIGNGSGGWGNGEEEYYTSNTKNVYLENGSLVICAQKEDMGSQHYTSGRIKTAGNGEFGTIKYGRIEMSAKLPSGNASTLQGIWPAFWMLGTDIGVDANYSGPDPWPKCGEIDIMERVNDDSFVRGTIHGPGYSVPGIGFSHSYSDDGEYHAYAVEWNNHDISWYFDGNLYGTTTRYDVGTNPWVFDHDFFILLNLAVGSSIPLFPGNATQNTVFPQKYYIDYVRVYKRSGTSPVITSVSSISAQQTQTITITGSGFGTQNAFDGNSQFLEIHDNTSNWSAGYDRGSAAWINIGSPIGSNVGGNISVSDWINLNVTQWTDTQIVISGFTGQYGLSGKLNAGDGLTLWVWNAQAKGDPATYNATVSSAAAQSENSSSSESPFTSHTITPSEPSTPLPPTTPHFP
jgi:beta-glucanase (GH16 family)